MDQLEKKTLEQDIDPLASVHHTDLEPLVNSYIQQFVQTKWEVAVHDWDLLEPPKNFQYLTKGEEIRIGNTKVINPISCPEDRWLMSPLWSNTHHWPYAPGVCIVTRVSWQILHSWFVEYSLGDNSRDLHSGIPARRGIRLIWSYVLTSTGPNIWTI